MVKYHKITNLLSGIICNMCKACGYERRPRMVGNKLDPPAFRIHDLFLQKVRTSAIKCI